MKTLAITVSAIFFGLSFSYAQADKEKDEKYKWGCAVTLNSTEAQIDEPLQATWAFTIINGDKKSRSYSLSVIPKYHLNNDLVLRFEIGITKLDIIVDWDYIDANHTIVHQAILQEIYRYSPGIQWNFLNTRRFELFGGINLPYYNYKKWHYENTGQINRYPIDTMLSWNHVEIEHPSGYATGIGAFAGINVFIIKHLSFGVECAAVSSPFFRTNQKWSFFI